MPKPSKRLVSHLAKLTPVMVRRARRMYLQKISQIKIAKELGVSQACVSYLLSGATYRRVL